MPHSWLMHNCAQQVDVTQVILEQYDLDCICGQLPAHQVSPLPSARRLAGARYQLDSHIVQAGIVGNGRHQKDPVFRWPGKHAYTDVISRNVITLLAHRFQMRGIQ